MSVKKKMKPNLKAQMAEHEVPEYKGKWRNLWLCPGRTKMGNGLYESKEAARDAALVRKDKARENHQRHGKPQMLFPDGYIMTYKDFFNITVIQIPVKE